MASRTSLNFLQASLGEFLSVWRMGGNATLHLSTTGGTVKIGYNLHLGHPDSPFPLFPPPSPPPSPHRPRHKGPAKRERDRQRAARHQAGRPAPAPPSSPPGAPSTTPPASTPSPAAPVGPSSPSTPAPAPTPPAPPAPGGAGRKRITTLPPDTLHQGVGVRCTRTPTIPQLDGVMDTSSSSATSTTPPPSPGSLPDPPPCKECGGSNTSWASVAACQAKPCHAMARLAWGMDQGPCAVDLATHPRLGCTLRTCSAHWPPPIQ